MNKLKKTVVLCTALAFTITGCRAKLPAPEEALKRTAAYELETVNDPMVGSVGGEWAVIPLARSGQAEQTYLDTYYANLEVYTQETKGVLSERKYTEYSRVVLALRSIGKDPQNVSGYDLLEPLEDFEKVTSQGLNGAVFALLALDADGVDKGTVEMQYLDYILNSQKSDGGFSIDSSSDEGSADITSMALQSLAPYQDNQEVRETVDRGVEFLAESREDNGTYVAYGEDSSESIAQAVIALSTLGIDCNEDERFSENGLLDTLMQYYKEDGSFSHTLKGESNPMATDQAFCALVSYDRLKNGQNSLYDMTDY